MRGSIFLIFCGLAISAASSEQVAQEKRGIGVIGNDDRKVVTNITAEFNAIGHINVTSFSKRRHCTGTLIAPNLVVTSAHCVVDRLGNTRSASHIHFVAGVDRGDHLGHAKAKCVHLAKAPYTHERKFSPEIINDVAVVVLAKKLDIPPLQLVGKGAFKKNVQLVHPSYPRDSRYALLADFGCRLRGRKYGIWLTDCDTNFASSGGPVLIRVGSKLQLGAVMSGFIPDKFSVAVPVSRWPELMKTKTCLNN